MMIDFGNNGYIQHPYYNGGQKKSHVNGNIEPKSSATPVITNVNAASHRLSMQLEEDNWYARHRMGLTDDNPLTTATAAMLNLNGGDEHTQTHMGLLYDYYRQPNGDKGGSGKSLNDIWHSGNHESTVEVSTIRTAGSTGQTMHRSAHAHHLYKSQQHNQDTTCGGILRNSPDHSTASMRSHHSSPSSSDQSLNAGHHSPHSTSPGTNHAVVSSSTFSSHTKHDAEGNSVIMKQEQHTELPPIHQAAFGAYYPAQAVPYVTSLTDQTVLLQAANGEYYRAPIATASTMMDYGYGFQARVQTQFQDPSLVDHMTVERYRQAFPQSMSSHIPGMNVDLPSPDSGLGEGLASREHSNSQQQMYDSYNANNEAHNSFVTSASLMSPETSTSESPRLTPTLSNRRNSSTERTPVEKLGSVNPIVNIPKVFSNVGFRYYLESPISTSQKREEDRITYINKGQFYPITLEYIPDPDKPLKSQTVKSTIMLVFREEKTSEEEAKAWQFWHSRQHSIKQRIFDADTKNSIGLVGCIEETSHNAISVYWNPHEGPAKVNIAVQCLSTDFSNQKGVKGLPLHIQIDTHEDLRAQGKPFHRGYCQIKIFCDKGAERKTRDEERRAAKRKMAAAGRKKLDDLYHPNIERSEFYAMADLAKPPLLFTPAEDLDRLPPMELGLFYNAGNGSEPKPDDEDIRSERASSIVDNVLPPAKRIKIVPPVSERVMLYMRKESDEAYTALHLVPPTIKGLTQAIYLKYGADPNKITKIFKKNSQGSTVEMDDDMVRLYSNEDTFVINFQQNAEDDTLHVYLTELPYEPRADSSSTSLQNIPS
ncbi:hypothetical protein RvY_10432-2 [Ramazzottius varieornatus]|uniref:Grh/CP2 DB domain-containing protein n=1 Tax=Ramazzottius varieornatus TaxID=947166 RepID=A0A1D1VLR9_RAMVA|nr:hypothetical protein RvY_10432-2 [Ramazzottius varieornatus]